MSIDERESQFLVTLANKKDETKKILNGNINGNELEEPINISNFNLSTNKLDQSYYRWDNLIYIEIICFIGDFPFKEEFLWEKTNTNVKDIKEFAITILMENEELNKKVALNYEFLEVASEYITSKVLQEIKFYQSFDPYKNLQNIFFEQGYGLKMNAHLININIDLKYNHFNFKDHFVWDMINPENIPELFAEQIVFENNLPLEARNSISLIIRRNIKEYVFKIFRSLTALYPNLLTLENDVFLTSLIKDINSLKSFLNSVKQNTQNPNYKLPHNNPHLSLNNKMNGNFIQSRSRKGRGGRYKNDIKNSSTLINIYNNNEKTNPNGLNSEIINTDFSDNFEATENHNRLTSIARKHSEIPNGDEFKSNGILDHKIFGRRKRKIGKNLNNKENEDLNLSLNEDRDMLNVNFNDDLIKKPRGRRKLINKEDNLKFTFELPFSYSEIINANKNIVFFNYDKIVILKDIFESNIDAYDRFIIEKHKLEQDVLEYFS